jgi:Tol biopolymer transport system component
LLHVLHSVSLPRWSPDGRWLAVSHWSRELPYQIALVEVGTGKVIPIPQIEYLGDCAWSPDSRELAFVAYSYPSGDSPSAGWLSVPDTSVHVIARDLNYAFECMEMAWSADSRRFVALMHREYEHDDVRATDLWLFGLKPGVCRLTVTPDVEESSVGWLDDRRVIFRPEHWDDDEAQSGFGTVLELPALAKSPH